MFTDFKIWLATVSTLLLAAMLVIGPGSAMADSSLLKSADKQIASKKFKAAARTITKAMNSGALSDSEMATALYRRGVAYNGAGRTSSAIADLSAAIWLKKLSGTALQEAYRQRAAAYKATGHNKLAGRDFANAGVKSTSPSSAPEEPATALALPPLPTFKTVVHTAKTKAPAPRAKVAKKPTPPKKAVIPAFRTSVATE